MPKAIVTIGYDDFIVDAQDALKLHEIIAKAERYKQRYRSRDEGGPLHYVWPQDDEDSTKNIRIISDDLYRVAKLAGKYEA